MKPFLINFKKKLNYSQDYKHMQKINNYVDYVTFVLIMSQFAMPQKIDQIIITFERDNLKMKI